MKAGKLTVLALLTAAALAVFIAEAQLPPPVAAPGVKLGLSNIFVLVTMYIYGRKEALTVLTLKILLGSMFSGQLMSLLYSAAGGALCFCVMAVLRGLLGENRLWAASALSAIAHNIGQLLTAVIVLGTEKLIMYLPVLIISGVLTGLFTGICAQITVKRLRRALKSDNKRQCSRNNRKS